MIALDTNILVYAHRADVEPHAQVFRKVKALAEGGAPWGIPVPCVHEFLAVVTNARLWKRPTPLKTALDQLEAWAESPTFLLLHSTSDHLATLKRLCAAARATGGLVHDARIAAICIENGVRELWTADRDFSRFPALKTRNPLVD